MLVPERRTRTDLIVAGALALVTALVAAVIWFTGDAHGSDLQVAAAPLPKARSATSVPEQLATRWETLADPDLPPVAVAGAVVIADDQHTITGRDPNTGEVAWTYRRDRELCAMVAQWQSVIAFYRDDRGCGQVVRLDGSDGRILATRSSDMDDPVTVTADGTHILVMGATRIEMLRSDLVRTVEYGRVDAPAESGRQPQAGCTFLSARSIDTGLAVLERCPDESGLRLTMTEPVPKNAAEPKDLHSTELTDLPADTDGARVLAIDGDRTTIAVPSVGDQPARLLVYGDGPIALGMQPLPLVNAVDQSDVVDAGPIRSWWTGAATAALPDGATTVSWMRENTLGAGAPMAGDLLIPAVGTISVTDPLTGQNLREISVDRGSWTGPVRSVVMGTTLVEQRGDVVVGLG